MLGNEQQLAFYKTNTLHAAEALNWEKEKTTLIQIFSPYA
jgi:hypothetical protein